MMFVASIGHMYHTCSSNNYEMNRNIQKNLGCHSPKCHNIILSRLKRDNTKSLTQMARSQNYLLLYSFKYPPENNLFIVINVHPKQRNGSISVIDRQSTLHMQNRNSKYWITVLRNL